MLVLNTTRRTATTGNGNIVIRKYNLYTNFIRVLGSQIILISSDEICLKSFYDSYTNYPHSFTIKLTLPVTNIFGPYKL